jgi:uncharacterized protein (TIGR02284 family)
MAKDIVSELNELIKLDRGAIRAYEQAIEACQTEVVREKLREFQGDHERHVSDLSAHVRVLGGTPEERRDFKGMLIEGFTAITSQGDHSALLAMRGNEELTNRKYASALEVEELTGEVRTTVERNYHDEERHLAWIKDALDQRIWEKQQVKAA